MGAGLYETDEATSARVLAHACGQLRQILDDYRRRVLARLAAERRADLGPLLLLDLAAAVAANALPAHHVAIQGDLFLDTLGLRCCYVAAMRSSKLSADGVVGIEESYDVSANVFSPVDQRKKAPPMVALEPRTLDLVRRHRRYLTAAKASWPRDRAPVPVRGGNPAGRQRPA